MTNEKLGVLLVDVPEPRLFRYYPLVLDTNHSGEGFILFGCDKKHIVEIVAYKCTKDEARKYPQFKWVALEDL